MQLWWFGYEFLLYLSLSELLLSCLSSCSRSGLLSTSRWHLPSCWNSGWSPWPRPNAQSRSEAPPCQIREASYLDVDSQHVLASLFRLLPDHFVHQDPILQIRPQNLWHDFILHHQRNLLPFDWRLQIWYYLQLRQPWLQHQVSWPNPSPFCPLRERLNRECSLLCPWSGRSTVWQLPWLAPRRQPCRLQLSMLWFDPLLAINKVW